MHALETLFCFKTALGASLSILLQILFVNVYSLLLKKLDFRYFKRLVYLFYCVFSAISRLTQFSLNSFNKYRFRINFQALFVQGLRTLPFHGRDMGSSPIEGRLIIVFVSQLRQEVLICSVSFYSSFSTRYLFAMQFLVCMREFSLLLCSSIKF